MLFSLYFNCSIINMILCVWFSRPWDWHRTVICNPFQSLELVVDLLSSMSHRYYLLLDLLPSLVPHFMFALSIGYLSAPNPPTLDGSGGAVTMFTRDHDQPRWTLISSEKSLRQGTTHLYILRHVLYKTQYLDSLFWSFEQKNKSYFVAIRFVPQW